MTSRAAFTTTRERLVLLLFTLICRCCFLLEPIFVDGYSIHTTNGRERRIQSVRPLASSQSSTRSTFAVTTLWMNSDASAGTGWEKDDRNCSSGNEQEESSSSLLPNLERAWRYAKKPLLRIGSKGATLTHGNSLRQLLNDHTIVKVKINTRKFGTMDHAFEVLKELSEESGAPKGIECIQTRDSDKVILFGLPGTMELIQAGEFPPTD